MTTIVELRVHMDCPGCERKIKKALLKLDGVDSVDIDMRMQKVLVTGWMDQEKVLETVQKTGRLVELWPFPPNPELHAFNYSFYNQLHQTPPASRRSNHHFAVRPDTYYASEPISYAAPDNDNYDDSFSSYNYSVHNSNGHDHGYYNETPSPGVYSEKVTAIFSDENAHGCSVM